MSNRILESNHLGLAIKSLKFELSLHHYIIDLDLNFENTSGREELVEEKTRWRRRAARWSSRSRWIQSPSRISDTSIVNVQLASFGWLRVILPWQIPVHPRLRQWSCYSCQTCGDYFHLKWKEIWPLRIFYQGSVHWVALEPHGAGDTPVVPEPSCEEKCSDSLHSIRCH